MATMIHPTAILGAGVELGADVSVGPYAVLGAGVRVGRGTSIGPHVVVESGTVLGEDNRIFQFASVGADPQDKKYAGETTWLEIGDRNVIRESATIHRGTVQDRGVTRIGNDNLFMAGTHVAHDCVVGNHCVMANQSENDDY